MDKQLLYQKLFEAKGDCLSEEQLLDYVQGNLSNKEKHEVEKHLLSCELCDEAVEGLLLLEEQKRTSLILNVKREILKRTSKRNYLAWAAIFSGIFISASTIFYFTNNIKKSLDTNSMAYTYEEAVAPTEANDVEDENTTQNYANTNTKTETVVEEESESILEKLSIENEAMGESSSSITFQEKKEVQHKSIEKSITSNGGSPAPSVELIETKKALEIKSEPLVKEYIRHDASKDRKEVAVFDEVEDNEFIIEKEAINEDDMSDEVLEEEIIVYNEGKSSNKLEITERKKNKHSFRKKTKGKVHKDIAILEEVSVEEKSIDLKEVSNDMKKIALTKVQKDDSDAYKMLMQQKYKEAYSLYKNIFAENDKNTNIIYKTAIAGLFYNINSKEVEKLIDNIDDTEQGKWLKASLYLEQGKSKKAKKLLQELADNTNDFTQEAKEILSNLE